MMLLNPRPLHPTMPWFVVLMAPLLLLPSGCQFAPDMTRRSKEFLFGEATREVPDRMMVIWTDTVLHQPQQPGVRGFGARIYFFKGNGTEPIEVDGGLAVYAFNASGNAPLSSKPERKFVFTADQFSKFLSHTDMGPSYSIWVPWDQVGGASVQLSLVTRFEGRHGGVVISDPTVKLLPGVDAPIAPVSSEIRQAGGQLPDLSSHGPETVTHAGHLAEGPDNRAVRQAAAASHPLPTGSRPRSIDDQSAQKNRRRGVLTIDLPPSFSRHLKGDAQQESKPERQSTRSPDQRAAENPSGSRETSAGRARANEAAGTANTPRSVGRKRASGQRYPFRQRPQTPGMDEATGEPAESDSPPSNAGGPTPVRTGPLSAGWLRELPNTPRQPY